MITDCKRVCLVALVLVLCAPYVCAANSPTGRTYREEPDFHVDVENIDKIVRELASEKYAGRLPGTPGNWAAVEYVADYFGRLGLACPEGLDGYLQRYIQPVRMLRRAPALEILDEAGNVMSDFSYVLQYAPAPKQGWMVCKEVVGEGVVLESLSHVNEIEDGKILLIPLSVSENTADMHILFTRLNWKEEEDAPRFAGIVIETDTSETGYFPAYGIVSEDVEFQDRDAHASPGPLIFKCDVGVFSKLVKASQQGHRIKMDWNFAVEDVAAANVVAVLPGPDGQVDGDYVIIGAHIDHMGSNMDGTYNPGAMDNASGVAAMMEIARLLAETSVRPRRAVVFIALNGEEQGMWGSRHYAQNPCYPLGESVMINIDNIGSKHDVPLVIEEYAMMLTRIVYHLYGIAMQYRIDSEMSSGSMCDNASFALAGIEAVSLIHPDYSYGFHGPADTPDRVDPRRIAQVVDIVLNYLYTY
jgi:aminopeptidase YwaD